MVLRQQVDGEAVFEYGDAGMPADRLDERPFDLGARQVLVVEDAVLGVAAFAVQLETPVGSLVEARTTSPTASSSHLPAPQTSVSRMCFSKVSGA